MTGKTQAKKNHELEMKKISKYLKALNDLQEEADSPSVRNRNVQI